MKNGQMSTCTHSIKQSFWRKKDKRHEYAHDIYGNHSKGKKNKRHQYACKGYRNLSNFLWKYNCFRFENLFFSGMCKRDFLGLGKETKLALCFKI